MKNPKSDSSGKRKFPPPAAGRRHSRKGRFRHYQSAVVTEIDGGLIRSYHPPRLRIEDLLLEALDIESETTEDFAGATYAKMHKNFKRNSNRCARVALKTYKYYYGEPYELVSVQKAALDQLFTIYVTFTAKHTDDDVVKTKTFQAIVDNCGGSSFVSYVRIIPST